MSHGKLDASIPDLETLATVAASYGCGGRIVLFLPRPVQAMDPEWDLLTEVCARRRRARLL